MPAAAKACSDSHSGEETQIDYGSAQEIQRNQQKEDSPEGGKAGAECLENRLNQGSGMAGVYAEQKQCPKETYQNQTDC